MVEGINSIFQKLKLIFRVLTVWYAGPHYSVKVILISVSVQFSPSVMSNSLQPHGLQHTRLPCSSPTPGAYSNSCPSSRWCHPTISSSVVPFSSHLQSFPASGSSPLSQFFYIRWPKHWSFSFSISPSNEYSGLICSRIDWFDILAVPGTLQSLLQVLGYSFLNTYFKLSWLMLSGRMNCSMHFASLPPALLFHKALFN